MVTSKNNIVRQRFSNQMINTLKNACQTDYIMPDNPFNVKGFTHVVDYYPYNL